MSVMNCEFVSHALYRNLYSGRTANVWHWSTFTLSYATFDVETHAIYKLLFGIQQRMKWEKKQLYIIIITTNKHTYNVWNECFFAFLAQCRRDCFNAANFFMYAERAWNEMDLAFVCKIVKQTRNILPLFQFFLLVIQWFVTQQMEIMSSEFKQSASTGMLHKLTIWFSCK